MSTPKKLAASAAVLATVGAFMSFGVFSLFSSTQSNSSSLSSATFGLGQSPSTLLDTLTGLIPGDLISRCVQLTNTGSTPITVKAAPSLTNVSSGTLRSVVTMTIDEVSNVDTASSSTIKNCTATSGQTVTATQSILSETVGSAISATPITLPPTTGGSWAAAEAHIYRIQVSLPSTVTDFATYGGKSITPAVNFTADQIAGSNK